MTQELGPEARALLAAARHSPAPSLTDHWAVRRSVAARIGAASAAMTAGVATSKASATLMGSVKLSLLSQFGIATVAGATLATSAMVVHSSGTTSHTARIATVAAASSSSRSPAVRLTSQPPTPVTTVESEPTQPDSTPEPRATVPIGSTEPPTVAFPTAPGAKVLPPQLAPAREVSHASSKPVSMVASRLLDEGRALAQVQNALSEHRGGDALAMLEAQSQQFASGALMPERAAARVFALCDLGRRVESRAAAQRFAQVWPDSPLLGRVLVTCK
jgi:hypothetical protein